MLYGTQVKHKEMNLNVPSWFAILPFCTVSAVRKGKNLQRICRHSAKCSKTWLKSGPPRLSLLWLLVGMPTNKLPDKCSEDGELCNF